MKVEISWYNDTKVKNGWKSDLLMILTCSLECFCKAWAKLSVLSLLLQASLQCE